MTWEERIDEELAEGRAVSKGERMKAEEEELDGESESEAL